MDHNTHCCVETCSNIYDPSSDKRFFELPLDNQKLLDDWINAIGCEDFFMLSQNSFVCSDHFTEKDYVKENGFYELSSTAIPSIFRFKNSVESSNDDETTIDFNESNNIQNWGDSFPINNVDTQANDRNVRRHTSSTISNKTVVISGCGNKSNSPYNNSKINHDEIVKSNKSSINNSSNQFIEDLFFMDIDRGDGAENISNIVNLSKNSVSNTSNTAQTGISKKYKTKLRPMWDPNKAAKFKQREVSESYLRILRSYGRKNTRLQSKVRDLLSRKLDFQDVQINYFQLVVGVLGTEHQLLLNGVDTTGYAAFRIAYEDTEIPKSKDIECDVVIEYKLKELKNSHIDNNSMASPKCPTQLQPSTESDTVIILH